MGRGLVPLWELQQAVLSPVLLRKWPCGVASLVTSSNSGKITGVSSSKSPDKPQTKKRKTQPIAVASSKRVKDPVLFCIFLMCFVLRINKQKNNKVSSQGLDHSSSYFNVNPPKQPEKQAPDWCLGALFFFHGFVPPPCLITYFRFPSPGPCKTKHLPQGLCCTLAGACSGLGEEEEEKEEEVKEEEGRGACRSCVFPVPLHSSSVGAL